jgi:NADPH:quinone reductase-like Zn-dependent oxidoreductase
MSRAVQFSDYGPSSVLHVADVPAPVAGPGQVRIAVKAAGVNPFDWKVMQGYLKDMMPLELPAGLGSDVAGVVDQVGEGVTADRVVLVEPTAERRGFAPASRVDMALTPTEAQTQLTRSVDPLRADIAIECSGNASATHLALATLRPGGVLVVVGSGVGATLDPLVILLNEITVRGTFTYIDEFEQAIDLRPHHGARCASCRTEAAWVGRDC